MTQKERCLKAVAEKVSSCRKCELSKNRKKTVPGTGKPDAKVMVIGEAPGKNEDEQGLPFVGRAGSILDEALEKAGKKREDVFITNVVKCRPPNNRDPRKKEVESCNEYLEKQIKTVDPDIILPVGNHALQRVLGKKKISQHRGKIYKKNGRKYMPTYHPAATIYNRKIRPRFEKDIQKAFEGG